MANFKPRIQQSSVHTHLKKSMIHTQKDSGTAQQVVFVCFTW